MDRLPIDEAKKQTILESAGNYLRHARIKTDIVAISGSVITVRIEQVEKLTDKVFTGKELAERAKLIFAPIAGEFTIRVRPLVFSGTGADAVSAEYVRNSMKKHGLTQTDLCAALGIDKTTISRLMNGKIGFTRWHRLAFYHYFKNLGK